MSVSHKGIQTMISYVNKSTVFMQPSGDDISTYVLYTRAARVSTVSEFNCSTIAEYKIDLQMKELLEEQLEVQMCY
jgi:hypothetical protein